MTTIISKRGLEKLNSASKKTESPSSKTTLTSSDLIEFVKCASNPIYFINTYVKVSNPRGLTNFHLEQHQVDYINAIANDSVIALLPRQSGTTITSLAFILWEALFKPNHKIMAQSINMIMTKNLYDILNDMISNLPSFMTGKNIIKSKHYIEFPNKSRIHIANSSSLTLKGHTFDRLYIDNFALLPESIQEDLFLTFAPLMSHTKVILSSTPRGKNNTFYEIWKQSLKPNYVFVPFKRTVYDLPLHLRPNRPNLNATTFKEQFECEFV